VELESIVIKGVHESTHTLNQSMMLKAQLRVMIHLKSNSTVLPQGEQEGIFVHLNDMPMQIWSLVL